MARARNIKPSFFDNDDLAENDPLGRLLFIGMWTLADFKGDMEWRPKRIKAQLLPFDNCDVVKLAINLDQSGFIRFYSVQGVMYLHIPNFGKHQNPHKNERDRGSDIPPFDESTRQVIDFKTLTINRDQNGIDPDQNGIDPADSLILNPDSLTPNPDSLTPNPDPGSLKPDTSDVPPDSAKKNYKSEVADVFDHWKDRMQKTDQTKLTAGRKEKIAARLREGYSVDHIKQAIDGCAGSAHHMGQNDQGTVYDDITLICRSGDKLEWFASNIAKVTPLRRPGEPETVEDFQARSQAQASRVRELLERGGLRNEH